MDNAEFSAAQTAYDAGDYAKALPGFSAYLSQTTETLAPGECGRINHLVGNCLVKLRRYQEAATSYKTALADPAYDRRGAVNANLGMALCASRRYEEALPYFEAALADDSYVTKYKAHSGMGTALLKLDRTADAGIAYRRAALDEENNDPAKALVNLGVCFMALNRPHDAVESYRAALELDVTASSRNKTLANLGQAYVATGRMDEAVKAFEEVLAAGDYQLSEPAAVDYATARGEISPLALDAMTLEVGSGTSTTQISPVGNTDDLAAHSSAANPYAQPISPLDTKGFTPATDSSLQAESLIPSADDTGFFTLTEAQMAEMDRTEKRQKRQLHHVGLKVLITILVILILLVGAGIFAYTQGYGFPTQETVVTEVLGAGSSEASQYWASGVDADTVTRSMAAVEAGSTYSIESVSRSMGSSEVTVLATLPEGGTVHYTVQLVRDKVSWKVASLSLVFTSNLPSS